MKQLFTHSLSSRYFLLLGLLFGSLSELLAQKVNIRGKVVNARTNEPVSFANVQFIGTPIGMQTDLNGAYGVDIQPTEVAIKVSFVGFVTETRTLLVDGSRRTIILNFRLKPQQNDLSELTVKAKRSRYRNRDNPAVALIQKVIDHKAQNRQESFSYYQYNKHEKIEFDLSNISEKFRNKRSLRKFDFVFDHLDTSAITGKVNLPIYLKETISNVFYRKNPEKKREFIEGEKSTGLGGYMDSNGIKTYIEALYQDVNVYDNQILLLSQQFLSPTSPLAPQFYQYALVDTTYINGVRCVNLGFSPRNKTDMLFQGTMAIALDSSYAIRKVEMGFTKDVNVNFVTDMRLSQQYDFVGTQGLMLIKDDLAIEFNLLKKDNNMGLFGQRSVSYRNYKLNQPIDPTLLAGMTTDSRKDALNRDADFWTQSRHDSLSPKEQGIYTMIDSVKNVPVFQKVMNTALFLLEGYKPISGFEIGPVNTFYSFNPVEGFRLRVGGRTTFKFSERFALETYGAYGFRDKRPKFFGAATWSLADHNTYTYPIKHIRVSYQDELKIPGQELQFVQEDNFLLSFKRGPNNYRTYNRVAELNYLNESKSGFALNLNLKRINQTPGGALSFDEFTPEGELKPVRDLTTTEFTIGLRYAPHEQFYQGKNYRVPIVNKYPIMQLRYTAGLKGVLGGEYNFHRFTAYFNKRFYESPFGYTDLTLEGGKTFGVIPYPLLSIHRANQSYAYQLESYNMMNFLEFISSQYGTVFVDHYFNGFIFNKLPLIKKLNLREIVTFKGLWGSLDADDRPSPANDLMRLPVDANGNPISFTLGRVPYMEASVGIANIFKILRVDFVKRLSYLNNPNVPKGIGVRFRMRFEF